MEKTSSSNGSESSSSSSSVSRNPPATQVYDDELLQRFQNLWSIEEGSSSKIYTVDADGVEEQRFKVLDSGIETGFSSRDLGERINGVEEQRFEYLGLSSNNPRFAEDELQRYNAFKKNNRPTTQAQMMASASGLINGGTFLNSYGDLVGNYSSSLNYGLDGVPAVNSVSQFNGHTINHQPSNGYTLEDQNSPHRRSSSIGTLTGCSSPDYLSTSSSIGDEVLDVVNLKYNLIELRGWSIERALKICNNDPSLLDEIEPHDIVLVAELKLGSLYLQGILKDQHPMYFMKIFNATLDFTFHLMINPEGTYVLRKLHCLCDTSHMKQIVEKIISRPDELRYAAKNEFGTGTLVKLIRVLRNTNPLLLKFLLYALTPEFLSVMKSKPGSNLMKLCLKYLDSTQNQFLYNGVSTHCLDLATHDSGYVSLIALIENTPNPYKEGLLCKISDKAVYLSQDPKGNYVIQAILDLRIPAIDLMICRNLVGSYLGLSKHKCASNVVEKCIMSSGFEYPVLELIFSNKLHLLSQDPMGNYVVQKALNATQQLKRFDLYASLVGAIQPHSKHLQNHPIGRNVFRQMNKRKLISEFV